MSNVIELVHFKLKKGASKPEFLAASDKLNKGVLSKQKGFISRQLLSDGDKWVDFVVWQTMGDAQNAAKALEASWASNPVIAEFGSFMDQENCEMFHFSVERNY